MKYDPPESLKKMRPRLETQQFHTGVRGFEFPLAAPIPVQRKKRK